MQTKEITINFLIDIKNKRCGASCKAVDGEKCEEEFAIIELLMKGMEVEGWSIIPTDVTGKQIKEAV